MADGPDYAASGLPWRSRIGYSLNQRGGYIAERLFIDETDIANSPIQTFGPFYMPGDIKYKDINRDGKIDESDLVPIGYPKAEINFMVSEPHWDIKRFDFLFFFSTGWAEKPSSSMPSRWHLSAQPAVTRRVGDNA